MVRERLNAYSIAGIPIFDSTGSYVARLGLQRFAAWRLHLRGLSSGLKQLLMIKDAFAIVLPGSGL